MRIHHPYLYKDTPYVADVGDSIANINMVSQTFSFRLPNRRMNKGDLLVMPLSTRTDDNTFNLVGGWTQISDDRDVGLFFRQQVWFKTCDGTEVPNSTHMAGLSGTNTTHVRGARCLLIPNASIAATPYESSGLYNATDTWKPSSITSTLKGALALTLRTHISATANAVITGQTGGTWEKPFADLTLTAAFTLTMNFQQAELRDPVTISGGSATPSDLQIVRSFAIKPLRV